MAKAEGFEPSNTGFGDQLDTPTSTRQQTLLTPPGSRQDREPNLYTFRVGV